MTTVAAIERARTLLVDAGADAAIERLKCRSANGSGVQALDQVEAFLARFVSYPSEHARVAHTLWIAHTHAMDAWDSTPRAAFLSPEPGSGKSRALEVTELLVPRPVQAINVTPAYLFRKVSDEAGRPTVLYDEVDTVFGPKAANHEETRGLLNAGHRRHSTAGRCVVVGKAVKTEELPAYCAVALAGLGDLPDTILTRSVIFRMRRRAPGESIEPFRQREHSAQAEPIRGALEAWMLSRADEFSEARPTMPPTVTDRDADVWEPLLAVADAAGGDWPKRARDAAVSLVSASKAIIPSLGVRLLADLRVVFGLGGKASEDNGWASVDRLASAEIIRRLCALDEAPWGNLRGKALDQRGLAGRLRPYGVSPKPVRVEREPHTVRGYCADDLHDAWVRYLGPPGIASETSETSATVRLDVSDVSLVSPTLAGGPTVAAEAEGEL